MQSQCRALKNLAITVKPGLFLLGGGGGGGGYVKL